MIHGFLNDDTCGVIALLSAFLTSTCCMTALKTIRGKINKIYIYLYFFIFFICTFKVSILNVAKYGEFALMNIVGYIYY